MYQYEDIRPLQDGLCNIGLLAKAAEFFANRSLTIPEWSDDDLREGVIGAIVAGIDQLAADLNNRLEVDEVNHRASRKAKTRQGAPAAAPDAPRPSTTP